MALKSGWLYKTPPNITRFLGWKKRHFDLFDNGDLAYSRSRENDTVLGLIHLSEVEEITDAEETVNCLFAMGLYCPSQKRTLYLRAETRAEIDSWCREIQRFVPAYAHHPLDYRPVYRCLPDEVMNTLPALLGFLYTPEMDLFAKQKFCAISEGQFRIYSNQSQEHLYLIFSLLCCKGVQELTDNTRGRSNSFQFKIEFTNKQKNSLVLSAKSPFERQGWIVCLMKTITVLSKYQDSIKLPLDDERRRSESAPTALHLASTIQVERQVAELREELNKRDLKMARLRDDKLALSNKLSRLIVENEKLKRQRPRSDSESSHLFPAESAHQIGAGTRPNTLAIMSKPGERGMAESYASGSSGECNFKDCSSAFDRPNSSNTDQLSVSMPELVQAQLLTLCQELGCLDVHLDTDLVTLLTEYIEQLRIDFNETNEEKDKDIITLETCKIDLEETIGALKSKLANTEKGMSEMSARYETQLNSMKEENAKIEELKIKLGSELEALKEENKTLTDLSHQMEEKQKCLLEEIGQITTERDNMSENNIRLFSENNDVCADLNLKNSELVSLRETLRQKDNEIERLTSLMPQQPPSAPAPKKPPLPPS